jgi:hypothetical protein
MSGQSPTVVLVRGGFAAAMAATILDALASV